MSKKLRGIGVQLVGFFVLAILIPTLILAFRAIETTKSAQTENLKLTSVQTLQETKMGFTNYLKNISQPVDLLTRNDAVKHLEDRGDYDTNVTTVQDALIASVKVTNGAERAYFSTVTLMYFFCVPLQPVITTGFFIPRAILTFFEPSFPVTCSQTTG